MNRIIRFQAWYEPRDAKDPILGELPPDAEEVPLPQLTLHPMRACSLLHPGQTHREWWEEQIAKKEGVKE